MMWQNNGVFGGNGQFQNNFNQDNYPPSPFSSQPMPGHQYFAQHPNLMQYEDASSEGYQPELPLYNEGAFSQNRFINPGPQFSPPAYNVSPPMVPTPRPPAQINARAAELKAQLLKNQKGRGSSATPPVHTSLALATKETTLGDGSSSLRASPKTPITAEEKHEQELKITELISQYSEPQPAAATSVKQEKNNTSTSSSQRGPVHMGAKSQAPSLGSPTNATKLVNIGNNTREEGKQVGNNTKGKYLGNRHTSNGSVSEGEILEEKDPNRQEPTKAIHAKLKEAQTGGNDSKVEALVSRRAWDERTDKPNTRSLRDESPPRRLPPANPKSQVQRNRDDRRDDVDVRSEKRAYQPEYKNERKQYPDSERLAYQRRDDREEDHRRPGSNDPRREEVNNRPIREQKPPNLDDVLPLDEDLREWLEITGYHNIPYRSKILNRRRAIAALDAQRDKLLAEMEQDERGGLPTVATVAAGQALGTSMLPPPIPNKLGGRAESVATPSAEAPSDTQHDRVVSNKRPYSDVGEPRGEVNGGGKIARTDDRGYQSQRIKEEDGPEYRRPRSGDFDISRRSPTVDRRERETSHPRYESRGRSRDRDSSPGSGRRVFESRPPPRGRGYDSDRFYDREDVPERGRGGFEVRGNYKGRAYDPNYRGRGRGRGRGDSREGRDSTQNPEVRMETGFGSTIANGRPFKDPKGFDRGGRGDTRYFIVKSFNEENVLRCIQDSVWTTQIQNGSIFKEAFETCKNVILVFSINKSRAFQGYARMESVPGSVESPEWQRAINWESAGAFRVRWLVICSTRFHRIGHLKNALNDNLAVLIGKDGQEIEENCGAGLIELIDEEASLALGQRHRHDDRMWEDHY
ncbi:YT521-B-like domain-containing protein [Rhexocercosporidium sp. MPI-PUGE-AT-0058]|nr:YT521-B-like domain-containing protein [Rhexocercosporidium sp. MPI-PUGE-AT-0058]